MRLTHDPRYNIAYLRLREKADDVETLHISESLNVDIGPDGTVYGIELLNANEQLLSAGGGHPRSDQRGPQPPADGTAGLDEALEWMEVARRPGT